MSVQRGPAPARTGSLVISLDFELFWGVRDQRTRAQYGDAVAGARTAVPALLALFEQRGIHATWATVGFLMFDGRDDLLAHLPTRRPRYDDPRRSPYPDLEKLGRSEAEAPLDFAPSLVQQVVRTPHQELATHTLSHFYCLEPGADAETFAEDLRVGIRTARDRFGVELRSIVFPRNQVSDEALDVCLRLGLETFRGNQGGWMHAPVDQAGQTLVRRSLRLADSYAPLSPFKGPEVRQGLVDLPATAFLRPWSPRGAQLEPLRLARLRSALRAAARQGRVFHLWWHPHNFGRNLGPNLEFLTDFLDTFDELRARGEMRSLTMSEAGRAVRGHTDEVAA